jgi:hypothetical protein
MGLIGNTGSFSPSSASFLYTAGIATFQELLQPGAFHAPQNTKDRATNLARYQE